MLSNDRTSRLLAPSGGVMLHNTLTSIAQSFWSEHRLREASIFRRFSGLSGVKAYFNFRKPCCHTVSGKPPVQQQSAIRNPFNHRRHLQALGQISEHKGSFLGIFLVCTSQDPSWRVFVFPYLSKPLRLGEDRRTKNLSGGIKKKESRRRFIKGEVIE